MGGAVISGSSSKGRVGISVGCLFPQSLVLRYGSTMYAVEVAREAGFDSLQLLPFWTYTRNELVDLSRSFPVVSFEGSWNRMYFDTRTTWGRLKKLDAGIIKDTILFGTGDRVGRILAYFYELFPDAMSIDIDPRGVREISPHHKMSRNRWLGYRGGVVLDTHHIYEFPFIQSYANAAKFVEDLFDAGAVVMVHVQIRDKKKLEAFLNGEMSSFEAFVLATMFLRGISLPIVAEIHPTILPLSRKARVKILGDVRKKIGDFLGE